MAENPNQGFQNDEGSNNDAEDDEGNSGGLNKTGELNSSKDSDGQPPKPNIRINMSTFKWHWVAVFAVAVITIYLSLLNGVSLETALIRSLYCTAIFWIIAEVVDWVIHKMK